MTISVIITVYNLENFVAQAIESVLRQTVKADEIIVVDDGSKDNSVKVVESFGDKVQLIRMGKNSGVLPSFIAGLKRSTGEILAFLDGDDLWMPDKLQKILQSFSGHPDVMMVTHLLECIDADGNVTRQNDETYSNCKRILAKANNEEELDKLIKNSILCYKGVWLGSAFCIRRSALNLEKFESWVYSLPDADKSHQDQPLAAFLIYANPGKRIILLDDVLFKYRVYLTNSSGASSTVDSALRTVNRSIATISRTHDVVRRNKAWKEENFVQRMKLEELHFYKSLYAKKVVRALKTYVKLFGAYWDNQKRLKETKRLLACVVLGPKRFLRTKTKNRFG